MSDKIWDYRVVRQTKDGEEWLSVQEVYYDDDETPYTMSDYRRDLNYKSVNSLKYDYTIWGESDCLLPKEMLPNNGKGGFIVEKNNMPIVSGFLYLTNSTGALFEWVVSNPEYKEEDRKEAIELLINNVEQTCKNIGVKYIFSIGRNKRLMETHKKLGWSVDKKPSYEIIKNL